MAETRNVLADMFDRFLGIEVTADIQEKLVSIVDKVEASIRDDMDLGTVQGQNTLRMLLATLVAYGWGIGMHPYHNPPRDKSGRILEVRASKDILVPVEDLQSIRYLKKDKYGRVRKALFEPDQNARVRSQIDGLLAEIAVNKWQEEEG
jgi:hypothetical protein